jgi:hypothetical protein
MTWILLLPLLSFATVSQDDISHLEKNAFPVRAVCKKMVPHDSPLIEVVSSTEIDCMSTKVNVGKFCEKEMAADPYYLRAYTNKEKKEVVCVSGRKVIFKYLCAKISDRTLCSKKAPESCRDIQAKLAKRLDIVHSSFTQNPKGIKQLNCYFESLPLNQKTE